MIARRSAGTGTGRMCGVAPSPSIATDHRAERPCSRHSPPPASARTTADGGASRTTSPPARTTSALAPSGPAIRPPANAAIAPSPKPAWPHHQTPGNVPPQFFST